MKNKKWKKKRESSNINFSAQTFFRAYVNAIQSKAIFFQYSILESFLTHTFLICLEKEALIAGYHFIKETKKVHIFLSYDLTKKAPLTFKFNFYSSRVRIKIAPLKILQQLYMQRSTSFTLINTPRGIMTLKDCISKKCGGEFLVTII